MHEWTWKKTHLTINCLIRIIKLQIHCLTLGYVCQWFCTKLSLFSRWPQFPRTRNEQRISGSRVLQEQLKTISCPQNVSTKRLIEMALPAKYHVKCFYNYKLSLKRFRMIWNISINTRRVNIFQTPSLLFAFPTGLGVNLLQTQICCDKVRMLILQYNHYTAQSEKHV